MMVMVMMITYCLQNSALAALVVGLSRHHYYYINNLSYNYFHLHFIIINIFIIENVLKP